MDEESLTEYQWNDTATKRRYRDRTTLPYNIQRIAAMCVILPRNINNKSFRLLSRQRQTNRR